MPAVSAKDVTDPKVSYFRSVPGPGPGVCKICHGAPGAGWSVCWGCDHVADQLSNPVSLVVPITLATKNGAMYDVLVRYKRQNPSPARHEARLLLAAMLVRFLGSHSGCISLAAGAEWDLITIVPSTSDRAGPHPLESVMSMNSHLESLFLPTLKKGPVQTTHNSASDQGFTAVADVSDRRVLLVDDTFTTGARGQSAASVLGANGAHVLAILPVARLITPGFSEEAQALWDKAKKVPFNFETCCVHSDSHEDDW